MDAFMQRSAHSHVKIVSIRAHDLIPYLQAKGAVVTNGTENELSVTGLDSTAIGAIAFEQGIPLNELSTQRASLETAFMELTHDSVEFRADRGPVQNVAVA
jgi:ABC-2 type transport system ATP-binding protein